MSVEMYIVNNRTKRMFEIGGFWDFDLVLCCDADALDAWLKRKFTRPLPYMIWIRDMILNVAGETPWDCEIVTEGRVSDIRWEDPEYTKVGSYFPMNSLHEDYLKYKYPELYAVWKVMSA